MDKQVSEMNDHSPSPKSPIELEQMGTLARIGGMWAAAAMYYREAACVTRGAARGARYDALADECEAKANEEVTCK